MRNLAHPARWALFTALFMNASCSREFENPFKSSPVGQKSTITPSLVNKMPLTEETDTARQRRLILRMDFEARQPSSGGSGGKIKSLSWARLEWIDKYGVSTIRTSEEIAQANNHAECANFKVQATSLIETYDGMVPLCEKALISVFENADKFFIHLDESNSMEFTSWGINFTPDSGAGSETLFVYTVSL